MSISKKNAEGYLDITAYEAINNTVQKPYRPLVYIASPFTGDTDTNSRRARGYCRFAVSEGYIPLSPHLHYPQFMDDCDKEERELGLFFALVLLGKCDELWVFGRRISEGMTAEIAKAKKRVIPIKYYNDRCEVFEYGT